MLVLIKEPKKEPVIKDIKNELEVLQGIVGGYIEAIRFTADSCIICNEDGRAMKLLPSFVFVKYPYPFVGTVIFVGRSSKGDFKGLSMSRAATIKSQLMSGWGGLKSL